jgi:hypothetical protein
MVREKVKRGGRQAGKGERKLILYHESLTQSVNAARSVQRSFLWADALPPHPSLLLLRI